MPSESEARARLNQIANTFSRDGLNSLPVIFGSHRKPQGLIIPIELWDLVEDAWDLAQADHRRLPHHSTTS